MDYDDRCFYIAISSEEDSHIKAYKEPKESVSLFRRSFRDKNDSFITASSVALELRTEPVSSSKKLVSYQVVVNAGNVVTYSRFINLCQLLLNSH